MVALAIPFILFIPSPTVDGLTNDKSLIPEGLSIINVCTRALSLAFGRLAVVRWWRLDKPQRTRCGRGDSTQGGFSQPNLTLDRNGRSGGNHLRRRSPVA
jgi:hypothetical protein